jgi:sucrose-6-phosphate hydrolase SacC (GH32 family)
MRRLFGLVLTAFLVTPVRGEDWPKDLVSWVPSPSNPVFQGAGDDAWDQKIRERGWILFEDGTFHLWYTGYNDARSPNKMLGHATSQDGVRWVRDPANPIHRSSWVEDMCVVKEGTTYFMFAEGKDDIAHLLSSTDRVHWEELGPLDIREVDGTRISPGPYGTPTVWVEGGTWYLFYERGDQGVWLASSKDRKSWTNVRDQPVLAIGPERYDKYAVAMNQVFKRGGVYYSLYHANAHKPWKDWTTCIARSNDLVHWEKYSGNPLIMNNSSSGILVEGPSGGRLYTMHPEVRIFLNPAPAGSEQKP